MKRKFLMYVIPSVLAMWIFSLYTLANGIFVARGAGEIALAAVNISMPYVYAIFAAAILFAVGTSTIAAFNLGNKNAREASEVFTMNMVILIILSFAVSVIVLFNLERIAFFLGATDSTVVYVKEYLGVMSIFSVFAMLSYYFEVLVKTDGHPQLATIGVLISAVTNIFFVYLFVIKFDLGVKGAAYATGLSQASASVVYIWHFIKRDSKIKFVRFKFDFGMLKRTIPIGISDFTTELSSGFITFMFNRIILKNIGDIGIITYTVIMFVNNLVLMTMTGVSQGTQPLVSYYYGRDDKKAYSYFLKTAVKTVAYLALAIYFVTMLFAEHINGIFINREQAELFNYSVKALRAYVPAYLIVGFNVIFAGFFSAIERPKYSMIISIGRGFVTITASLYVMTAVFGENGIWAASFVSELVCLIIGTIIFSKLYFNGLFMDTKSNNRVVETYD